MYHFTLTQLADGLAKRSFSSVELTECFLKRIAQFDSTLNSLITVDAQKALEQAKASDTARAQGQVPALSGIPLVHKDIFCTQGLKTSCGSKMLDNFTAPYDATIVVRMAQAGMVLLGKANMDEFAMGSSNENSFYGPVRNPWDHNRVPGGSSGGSAALVAARLAPCATGSDTGGSIRQPAALCGITGLKPTYGRVSRYGMIAFASSLDQAGPFAQTAQDIALLLQAMAGFDAHDATSRDEPVPNYSANLTASLAGKVIGLPKEYFQSGLDSGVGQCIEEAITVFKRLGARCVEMTLPHSPLCVATYYILASAECASNLSRYDGVRYGYRCADPRNLTDLYKRSRAEAFGSEVKRRIMIGTHVLSSGYYDAYYTKAQKVRRLISDDFKKAFESVDFILGPTTATPAFKTGEKMNDPVTMYLSDIYTIPASLAGLPAISLPAGFMNGLPIGLQLISNHFKEALLLNAAHLYQCETDWHQKIPTGYEV